jgi:hypothetical protein
MGTVTIAATYGSGGSVIGPAVAERLGLPFVDRAIPSSLVEKIHEPLAAALADDTEGALNSILTGKPTAFKVVGWTGGPVVRPILPASLLLSSSE